MGWKAIKTLNKQEHLDREANPSPQTNPVAETETKNALRELPLSETHEIFTGPGGWMVAAPIMEETPTEPEVVALLPAEEVPVSESDTNSVSDVVEKPVKKPPGKKKKVVEPT